jgi:hypothetical protein
MLAGSIANDKLVNSSLTIGNTSISLGGTSNTITGLSSVTSTAFVGTTLTLSGNATFSSTGALKLPSGTTAESSSYTTVGMVRFNTETDALEVYKSTGWAAAGGGSSTVKLYYYGSF